jgi:hypothetical protein
VIFNSSRGLRAALVISVLVVAGPAHSGTVAFAASGPSPSTVELESLRDQLAAAAPPGSVTYVNPAGTAIIMRIPTSSPTEGMTPLLLGHEKQVRLQTGAAAVTTLSMVHGGVRMQTTRQEISCSTGLIATGGGWQWMITAGHCVLGGDWNTAVWFTEGGYDNGGLIGVGTILEPSFPANDYGAIQISRITPYTFGPYVLMNGSPLRMLRVRLAGPPPAPFLPGVQVYKTGGSGLCGDPTARSYYQPLWEPLDAYGLTFQL